MSSFIQNLNFFASLATIWTVFDHFSCTCVEMAIRLLPVQNLIPDLSSPKVTAEVNSPICGEFPTQPNSPKIGV